MTPTTRFVFLSLASALCTACGSVPTRTFQFDAIDVEEKPLPALVVVGDDWIGAAERQQFVNLDKNDSSLTLELKFDRAEVDVTVAAVQVDPDTGKPTKVPKSRGEPNEFVAEPRRVQITDPQMQMFILPRR